MLASIGVNLMLPRRRLFLVIAMAAIASARQQRPAPPPIRAPHVALGDGPFIFDTAEQNKIRVVVVTKGLSHPWSLAFCRGEDARGC